MALIADNISSVPDSFFNGYLQPGATDSLNDVGIRTLQQSFMNVAGQMTLPFARSRHPIFTNLILDSASLTGQKGGYELLDVSYSGEANGAGIVTIGGNTAGTPLFETVSSLSRSTSQQSLDTHPNFKGDATSIIGVACGTDGTENAEIILRDEEGAFQRISDKAVVDNLKGASAYLAPSAEYSIRYASKEAPNVSNIGKAISGTPKGAPTASGISPGRAWLLTAIDYTQRGDIFEVTERYLLSDNSGWSEPVYYYS
jgi:hypothetical protein